jgi:hypothetical protein
MRLRCERLCNPAFASPACGSGRAAAATAPLLSLGRGTGASAPSYLAQRGAQGFSPWRSTVRVASAALRLPVGGSAPSRRTACFTRLQPQCKTGQRSEQRERRRERPQGANVASPSAPPSCHPRNGDPPLRGSNEGKCLPLKLPLGAASRRRRTARKAHNTPILLRRSRFSPQRKTRAGENRAQAPSPCRIPSHRHFRAAAGGRMPPLHFSGQRF